MTNEERKLITLCRVMIAGKGEFISYIREELNKIGFDEIHCTETEWPISGDNILDIIFEYTGMVLPGQ